MATQVELDEARAALHKLLTGRSAVKLQMNGRNVEYTPADRSALERYIKQLEVELGTINQRRPARVFL